LHYFA